MKKIIISLLLVTCIGLGLFLILQPSPDPSSPPTPRSAANANVKVIIQPIEITANDRTFQAVGTGRARQSIGIYPPVSEEVTSINFKAQDEVKQGDILVQLDDREEQLALRLSQVTLKDSKSLLERYNEAVKQGAVPESEVDAAQADYDGALVEMEQAKLAIEDRKVKAPFDGVVGIPSIDVGDRVNTDTMITSLDARDVLYVDFEVPEALAGALRNAETSKQDIKATTPAYPDETFTGYISAQESRLDSNRRTLLARASIENRDDMLRPGMSFETQWEIKGDEYPTVPEISVQWGREGSFIWVIRNDKAIKIPARVLARKAGRVLVDADDRLNADDHVVIEGLQRLRPDQTVNVIGTNEL